MSDPVERMKLFVAEQQQQVRLAEARALWSQLLPDLLPTVQGIVEVLSQGLLPGQFGGEPVSVLTDPLRELYPLVVAFGRRTPSADAFPRPQAVPGEEEIGASAFFRCEPDGHIHGYRYPFHSARLTLAPQPFVDLGAPHRVRTVEVGNAVADFLEWASVGSGCCGRRLQFHAPATIPFARPATRLSIIAA